MKCRKGYLPFNTQYCNYKNSLLFVICCVEKESKADVLKMIDLLNSLLLTFTLFYHLLKFVKSCESSVIQYDSWPAEGTSKLYTVLHVQ